MDLNSISTYKQIVVIVLLNFDEQMELEKQQYLENLLNLVKCSKSKNQFLKNVQQFDLKFTEAIQVPSFQNKPSYESFPSFPQIQVPQRPKNPFVNSGEQHNKRNYSPIRSNNLIPPTEAFVNNAAKLLTNNQNKMNIPFSRSESQFFKQQQGSKTYHAGFGTRQYEKPTNNQDFSQYPSKGPTYAWQMNEGYPNQPGYPNQSGYQNQPGFSHQSAYTNQNGYTHQNSNYIFEQQIKQNYGEMMKNFNNFNVNDQQRNYNANDLSINSHQNFNQYGGNHHIGTSFDAHPNQFLAGFSRQEDNFAKYYKKQMPNKGETPNTIQFMENRINPFQNRSN